MTYSLNISKSRMNHQACSLLSPFLPSTHPPFTMEKVELKGRPTTIQARTASCAASTLCVQQVIWSNWESPKLCGWWSYIYIYIYNIYIYICIVLFDGASILNDHSMIFTEHCWFMISFIYVICSRSRATPFLLVTSDWFRIYNNIHIIYIYKYIS